MQNAETQTEDKSKLVKSRPIQLFMQDKHEPFGTLSIDAVKAMLIDEDFSEMQSLYFYMMRDLKIASAVLTRNQQLLGQNFSIKSENQDFMDWANKEVPLDELIGQMVSAIYYGVSLTDVRYEVLNLKRTPRFVQISPRFLYADQTDTKGQLKTTREHLYIRQATNKVFLTSLDPSRIVFHKHPIDIGEITDFSLASKLVWYFSIKHLTLAHNLAYFDNVATPPLIAKSSGNEDELINTLYTLKSACVGVFDKDDVVEYLKVDNKADFLAFIEYLDRQIATLILGNTLSTGEGKNGSRAQSEVHENRQTDILKFDARLIEKSITAYLNRLEKLNFANAKGVVFTFDLKQKKNLLDLSAVVKNLSDSGFILDDADIEAQFGFKILGKKDTTPAPSEQPPSQPPGQANNHMHSSGSGRDSYPLEANSNHCACCAGKESNAVQKQPAKAYDALDAEMMQISTQKLENELMGGVMAAIAEASSYEQAYQSLLDLYPDMPLDTLEQALFENTANAHLLAAAEIEDESKQSEG